MIYVTKISNRVMFLSHGPLGGAGYLCVGGASGDFFVALRLQRLWALYWGGFVVSRRTSHAYRPLSLKRRAWLTLGAVVLGGAGVVTYAVASPSGDPGAAV